LTKKNQLQKHSTVNSDKSDLNQCYLESESATAFVPIQQLFQLST